MVRDTDRLRREAFDLLVIGGGIVGCGIARDAALRGMRVALVEKHDFASGTSSRSSKLVHGGIRYLERGEIRLVREASRERRVLLRIAPHLVRPLPFLMPIYAGDPRGRLAVKAGMALYDLLAAFRNVRRHRLLSADAALDLEPSLLRQGLRGAALFYDAQMEDARLCLENAIAAAQAGAAVANHLQVEALEWVEGRVAGALCSDSIGGGTFAVRATRVINATGPWADRLRGLEEPETRRLLRPSRGSHVFIDREAPARALLFRARRDGRVLFLLPWQGRTLLGTTDVEDLGDPDRVAPTPAEVEDLLSEASTALDADRFGAPAVLGAFAALRPLVASSAATTLDTSREERVVVGRGGLVTVAGGKYTTYRLMAERVVDRFASGSTTARVTLPGGATGRFDVFAMEAEARARELYGLGLESARRVVARYGSRFAAVLEAALDDAVLLQPLCPHSPAIGAEVAHAAREEMALTLEDALDRRLGLRFAPCGGRDAAPRAAAILARLLGWSPERSALEIARFASEPPPAVPA